MPSTHAKPPLRALQVFESAARCGSFTAAGEDLGITQSGVSRQISDLEATLGVALFIRNGARIALTPAGERLAGRLSATFDQVWNAVAEARRSEQVVTLSMLPSVATRWFAPRLGAFITEHPEIDLRITASRHLVDFAAEGVDAAIRYSPQPAPDVQAVKLAGETVRPVCAPAYAERYALREPQDLFSATLLYGDIPEDWPAWFTAAGCATAPQAGPRLGDDAAILQAAVDGQGVALGRSLLVADDLAAGKLVAPFDTALAASFSYWFVRSARAAPSATVSSVEAWLVQAFNEGGRSRPG